MEIIAGWPNPSTPSSPRVRASPDDPFTYLRLGGRNGAYIDAFKKLKIQWHDQALDDYTPLD
eukprot:4899899-Amphidinium_carterae.1